MKSLTIPCFVFLAAISSTCLAQGNSGGLPVTKPTKTPTPAPPPPPTPSPSDPITYVCPSAILTTVVNNGWGSTLAGDSTWSQKAVHKSNDSIQVRRDQGSTSDLMWCDYRAASDGNAAVRMQMSTVRQAPASHPKCVTGADLKSFICRVLGPGESY